MRDIIGLCLLILAGCLVTKHFALGIIPFIAGGWLLAGRGSSKNTDVAEAILVLGGMGAAAFVILYALAKRFL